MDKSAYMTVRIIITIVLVVTLIASGHQYYLQDILEDGVANNIGGMAAEKPINQGIQKFFLTLGSLAVIWVMISAILHYFMKKY